MSKLSMAIVVYVFMLTCCASGPWNCVYAQSTRSKIEPRLQTMKLENVHIEAQGIGDLFSRLSLLYNIPVGLEVALNDDQLAVYHIDLKNGTLSDLLNEFVREYSQYTWRVEDGIVNIIPKDNHRDAVLRNLLTTKIRAFSVKEKTSCWNLARSLATTPEIERTLKLSGVTYGEADLNGFYIQRLGKHFTFDVSRMPLKGILDKVVKESPLARIWMIRNDTFAVTLSLRMNARFEESPTIPKSIQ